MLNSCGLLKSYMLIGALSVTGCAMITSPPLSNEDEAISTQGLVTTRRNADLRYAPSFGAPVVATVPTGTRLVWIGNQQRNGFYRVVGETTGTSGWIGADAVTVTVQKIVTGFESFASCANTLQECTEIGCAGANSPDALMNRMKHHIPVGSATTWLTFDDLSTLQDQAAQHVGTGIHPKSRSKLAGLNTSNGSVSEGDAVRIVGYLASDGKGPHPNLSGESVNCGLKGPANNDFHIPVTANASDTEFDAVVVEMIPQKRPLEWTIARLKTVQKQQQEVWIEGNLYYDAAHRVNSDPDNSIGGQPKRFSLWEIHPVTKFLVCKKHTCDANTESDWSPL